jgi:hypothetical protein
MGGSSKPMGPHWGTCLQPRFDTLANIPLGRRNILHDECGEWNGSAFDGEAGVADGNEFEYY